MIAAVNGLAFEFNVPASFVIDCGFLTGAGAAPTVEWILSKVPPEDLARSRVSTRSVGCRTFQRGGG